MQNEDILFGQNGKHSEGALQFDVLHLNALHGFLKNSKKNACILRHFVI